jgi:DNA-binding NarL/FixJ family response regulator
MDRIRLLLLVDYVLVRESLSRQLQLEPDFDIVAECGGAVEGLEALGRSTVDVVLLDHEALGDRAAEFIATARHAGYQGRVLVLASEKDTATVYLPLRAGASGVFLKAQFARSSAAGDPASCGGRSLGGLDGAAASGGPYRGTRESESVRSVDQARAAGARRGARRLDE